MDVQVLLQVLLEANLIAVTQGAVRASAFEEKVSVAAWSEKPSWYIVSADDRMINPDAQRALAQRIGATTTTLATSHVPMLSQPERVAEVVLAAARHEGAEPGRVRKT